MTVLRPVGDFLSNQFLAWTAWCWTMCTFHVVVHVWYSLVVVVGFNVHWHINVSRRTVSTENRIGKPFWKGKRNKEKKKRIERERWICSIIMLCKLRHPPRERRRCYFVLFGSQTHKDIRDGRLRKGEKKAKRKEPQTSWKRITSCRPAAYTTKFKSSLSDYPNRWKRAAFDIKSVYTDIFECTAAKRNFGKRWDQDSWVDNIVTYKYIVRFPFDA